jgi:hypothetical protein
MNKDHILFQLREAFEELNRTIEEIGSTPDYGEPDFEVAITHIYHHLNTAWNSRNENGNVTTTCSDVDFSRWRQFPKDIDLRTKDAYQ